MSGLGIPLLSNFIEMSERNLALFQLRFFFIFFFIFTSLTKGNLV